MTKQNDSKKRVHNLIIVDESGSMEVIRKQAFVGMNETLQTVRKMQEKFPDQEQFVTLLTFDSGHTTWHYDDTAALKCRRKCRHACRLVLQRGELEIQPY